jgi:DNA-binding HxlR family transcriptional regulator
MLSTLPLDLLVALGRNRWMTPLLAAFARKPGWRFAELLHGCGMGRESLSRTLEAALAAGWIARNPGYGHPLRPEYILTPEGAGICRAADQVMRALDAAGISPEALTRWSLPALHSLRSGQDRFNLLARQLAPATPRALSMALRNLAANDLVAREIEPGYPPSSRYRLTELGLKLTG